MRYIGQNCRPPQKEIDSQVLAFWNKLWREGAVIYSEDTLTVVQLKRKGKLSILTGVTTMHAIFRGIAILLPTLTDLLPMKGYPFPFISNPGENVDVLFPFTPI